MSQTITWKLEYILNPFCPSKDKNMKKENKLKSIKEKSNTENYRITYMIQNLK